MALQMMVNTKFGEEKTAYMKVEKMRGDKNWLNFDVKGYISKDAANTGMEDIYNKQYGFIPTTDDRWDKQAYEYIKKLPEYEAAVDILEEGETL